MVVFVSIIILFATLVDLGFGSLSSRLFQGGPSGDQCLGTTEGGSLSDGPLFRWKDMCCHQRQGSPHGSAQPVR